MAQMNSSMRITSSSDESADSSSWSRFRKTGSDGEYSFFRPNQEMKNLMQRCLASHVSGRPKGNVKICVKL